MGAYSGTTTPYLLETPNVSPAVQKYIAWHIAQEGTPGRTPALDLNFAKNKSLVDDVSGSNLVTFTRTSAATYVDSNGVIKTTPINLYTYSKDFSSGWNASQLTVSTNQGLAPDGTNTAALITINTVATYNTLSKEPVLNTGTDYCYSVFVKLVSGSGTSSRAVLASANNQISPAYASYGLQLDTISDATDGNTPTTKGYVAYPNGWYRIYMVINTSAQTNPLVGIRFGSGGADSVATFYVWGAQVEEGTSPSEYIPTTSTISGAPRFDHDPVTGESLGLLIEESRTNLVNFSEDFTSWNKSYGGIGSAPSVTTNSGLAPDGQLTANRIVFTLNGGTTISDVSDIRRTITVTTASHTFSFYIRSFDGVSSYEMTLRDPDGLSTPFTVTGEWKRITRTSPNYIAGVAVIGFGLRGGGFADSDSADILVWGVQLEAGSFPTSYIPTIPTFSSRSSSATYYDSNGNIKTASTNIPRANAYLPDANGDFKPIGLLLESEETNIITFSQDPTRCYKFRVYTSASNLTVGVATITSNSPNSPSTVYITAVEAVDANNCDIYIGSQTGGVYNPATFTQGGNSYSGNGNVSRTGYQLYNSSGTSANIPTLSNVLSPDNVSYAYEQTGTIRLLNISGWTTTDYSVFSVFVKAKNATSINISNEYHSTPYSTFSFTTGTWSYKNPAHEQHFVEKHPNGWYRIGVLDTYGFRGFYSSITSTDSYYCWGFQYSKSSTMTSYIPTTGSQVTRSADVTSSSSITRSVDSALLDTSNWWDYTKGTAYAEYRGGLESTQSGYGRVWSPSGASTFIAANAAHLYNNRHVVWFGGIGVQVLGQEHLSSFAKNAMTYSNNGTNCDIVNASYPASATGTTNSSITSTSHGIGRNVYATANMLNGHIKRMTYWEQVLDPSTLQSLTE